MLFGVLIFICILSSALHRLSPALTRSLTGSLTGSLTRSLTPSLAWLRSLTCSHSRFPAFCLLSRGWEAVLMHVLAWGFRALTLRFPVFLSGALILRFLAFG